MFRQDVVHREAEARISKCYFTILRRIYCPRGEGWHMNTPRGYVCQAFCMSRHFGLTQFHELSRRGNARPRDTELVRSRRGI